jgi:inosine/xanthosine triphosphatase
MNKIVVGSKNPIKINSVKHIIKKVWPKADVVGIDVESLISSQPRSDKEMIIGAKNRALAALEKTRADLGIGIEGGVVNTSFGMFLTGWAVAVDKKGKMGLGSGGRILLPKKIAIRVRGGKELGEVADAFFKRKNLKQKEGTIGVLTKNLLTRTSSDEQMIIRALSSFISSQCYD